MLHEKKITASILNLPRLAKQIIALLCDLILCVVCIIGAFYLRLDILISFDKEVIIATLLSISLALPIFYLSGLYKMIFRYSGPSIIFSITVAITIYGLIYFIIIGFYRIDGIPRSIGILQPMLLFFGIVTSRLLVKSILGENEYKNKKNYKKTLIYGAGSAGQQIASSLESSFDLKVIGFLDDNKSLHGQVLQGKYIYNPNDKDDLMSLISTKKIELVLLALPSLTRFKRNQILKKLLEFKLKVQTLPSVSEIVDGKITMSDIKELDVNDILNRELVEPKKELIAKNIKNQNILVTGAGGSIGSELCKQIIKNTPKSLILCELNEFALYKIYEDLKKINNDLKIVPMLLNVQNENLITEILKSFKIDTVYHAAAYKHVPLVESNICEGVLNNVFGTYSVAKACINQNVSNFVLISSDKAVRPTNVMGATKRLAELSIQALFFEKKKRTNMSMVRFGNVLESSGSVIPKFKQQIKEGGPITLTHREVTRYFMTVGEAAQLVIQAGAMSENCDVFVLDMGESVKIYDLILRIVELSGLTVRDENNPNGDIEIKIIGLRPGEKLFEELLIGDDPLSTSHPKIKKANDAFIPFKQLELNLKELNNLVNQNDVLAVKECLKKIVKSYKPEDQIVDNFYLENFYFNYKEN